jgi:hypothetical protein
MFIRGAGLRRTSPRRAAGLTGPDHRGAQVRRPILGAALAQTASSRRSTAASAATRSSRSAGTRRGCASATRGAPTGAIRERRRCPGASCTTSARRGRPSTGSCRGRPRCPGACTSPTATVVYYALDAQGRLTDKRRCPWTGHDNGAPCGQPEVKRRAYSGQATVAHVTAAVFRNRWVWEAQALSPRRA